MEDTKELPKKSVENTGKGTVVTKSVIVDSQGKVISQSVTIRPEPILGVLSNPLK